MASSPVRHLTTRQPTSTFASDRHYSVDQMMLVSMHDLIEVIHLLIKHAISNVKTNSKKNKQKNTLDADLLGMQQYQNVTVL